MGERPPSKRQRIVKLTLDPRTVGRRSPEVEQERHLAIFDLLEKNHFALAGRGAGPYHLRVAIAENRLVLHVNDSRERPLETVLLPMSPFRGLIRDYFIVCESYYEAIRRASRSRIEAIDAGRRSLHDEGAELLRKHLAEKVDIDFDTGRRLFTLLSLLHVRG
ncbi:MAG: UPF0262 family protein [Proteobacteria bacterium]|nr:UPF0262 family protein [Pseudomonadota bacterium]